MNKGRHLIIDCYNVDQEICLDDKQMLKMLAEAASEAGCNVISQVRYHLGHNSPPGFTCMLLLDESHCSCHTYADLGMIALDIFTCGETDPNKVFELICNKINLGNYIKKEIDRFY